MQLTRLSLVFAACVALPLACHSQAYPTKPIRLILPGAPGGNADLLSRLVAQKVGSALGQPMVVENRTGAYGIIGTEAVARSAPDGYNVLHGNGGTNVANSFLYKNLSYDPVKDFTPIAGGVASVACITVNASLPVKSLQELIDYTKRNPGKLSYGSTGSGGSYFMSGEAFKAMAGTDIMHVPYRGLAAAMTDLVGGQIGAAFTAVSVALPHAKTGRVNILAVVQDKRYAGLPDVPTVAEIVPGYQAFAIWNGFFARAGTPAPVVRRLNAEIVKAVNLPEVIATMDSGVLLGGTPEQFGTYVVEQREVFANIVKLLGIKPE